MPPYEGSRCPGCGELYLSLHEHLQGCDTGTVKVWIFSPEYECPGHYPWEPGPLSEATYGNCDNYQYLIPREQYERWQGIQDAWEQMNEEMHKITGMI